MVEGLAGHARLDRHVKVLGVVVGDLVHFGQVEADAAVQRRNSGLQSGSSAEGDDRDGISVTYLANLGGECNFHSQVLAA